MACRHGFLNCKIYYSAARLLNVKDCTYVEDYMYINIKNMAINLKIFLDAFLKSLFKVNRGRLP